MREMLNVLLYERPCATFAFSYIYRHDVVPLVVSMDCVLASFGPFVFCLRFLAQIDALRLFLEYLCGTEYRSKNPQTLRFFRRPDHEMTWTCCVQAYFFTFVHTISKHDPSSERIDPTKGSEQPLADGAAILHPDW